MSPRNRWVSAAVLAIVLAPFTFVALARVVRDPDAPTSTPVDAGIFSGIGGWIV
jgi:hypothetical protein